jgi:hypothetical protein
MRRFFENSKVENHSSLVETLRENHDFDLPVVTMKRFTLSMIVAETMGSRKSVLDLDLVHSGSNKKPSGYRRIQENSMIEYPGLSIPPSVDLSSLDLESMAAIIED